MPKALSFVISPSLLPASVPKALSEYLKRQNVVGIADIDTRKLTRILREKGALAGCIMTGKNLDVAKALEQAQAFPGLKGMDLAKEVTVSEAYEWTEGSWKLGLGHTKPDSYPFHVVAYDFGAKRNILHAGRSRLSLDCGTGQDQRPQRCWP